MHSSLQPAPTSARGAVLEARRRDNCPVHQRPRVRELPRRLEPTVIDDFGGLLARRPVSAGESTTDPRGALS